MQKESHDVVILGGGLAGLTLALQLRLKLPALDVVVLERRAHPVREAAHKVGESSVEIGAHYFDTVLGLEEHLKSSQLRKFGLRFFFSDGCNSLDDVVELGGSRNLPTPSYQLDRGIFENYLGELVRERGMTFIDNATVRNVELGKQGEAHRVTYAANGAEHTLAARWVVDAAGRASILKRKLGLAEDNAHDANAVWFRIGSKIDIDEWSTDSAWLGRCTAGPGRWLSTNHFCGEGYWVWLIPLASGSHSVGIVADAKLHPLQTMNTFERSIEWLRKHQPRIASEVEARRDQLQDFLFLRNFSHGCKQVFSSDRWALTGEAGVFLDPFYSPGSDFIGISNSYVTDLIERDLAGEHLGARPHVYQQLYFSFYESTLSMYTDQYPMFGDPHVFPIKINWDYTFYWGVLCQMFFQRRLTDLTSMSRMSSELEHAKQLNFAMQKFLRQWSAVNPKHNQRVMLDQASVPWFVEMNRGLRDVLTEEEFRARIKSNVALLTTLAREIVEHAAREQSGLDTTEIRAAIGTAPQAATSSPLLFTAETAEGQPSGRRIGAVA